MAEGLADVLGPQWSRSLVENGEDAGVVRMLGQFRRGGGDPVGEAGDGLAGDREVLEVCLGLPQPGLQALDLPSQVVGLGPGARAASSWMSSAGRRGWIFTRPPPLRARWGCSRR
ncbi:hypothetical protein TPA0910_13290 [Streptomyces hygroscopicus subsp. sporocinereus]|uniref:Uncharacterized protein n=1 Tax=Streptomyces hygroscopicus TaxID=1912 RepID=A0ABQ3TU95_STRHY|nr:hypothetical protein TPA0910_13290 [Streptomyces hygroscopicus]